MSSLSYPSLLLCKLQSIKLGRAFSSADRAQLPELDVVGLHNFAWAPKSQTKSITIK